MRTLVTTAIFNFLQHRAEAFLRSKTELWQDLEKYLKSTPSTNCQYSDFDVLYKTISLHKPHYVLELGTGSSTVVIGHALKENGFGKVISMEEDQYYYDVAKKLLPPSIAEYVDILLSPAVEKTYGFFRGGAYRDIPSLPYEFVFVDGPHFLTDVKQGDIAFGYDLVEVIKNSERPVRALVDTRHSTCYVLHQILGDKFRFDYIRKLGVVLPSTRKDIRTPQKIVSLAMQRHPFKRPPRFPFSLW